MKSAYIFPGQGAQFSGMGKTLYQSNKKSKECFEIANEILGFDITQIMFEGSNEELRQTNVTQPAIFIHSIAAIKQVQDFQPLMVAGHSLGEFSALVANGVLSFEDGLLLVSKRASAMQEACKKQHSTMAAVLGLADDVVENICEETKGIVVAANYNCPGQLVISGEAAAVTSAVMSLKAANAKRVLMLSVGGAFHSPLMQSAAQKLTDAIHSTQFKEPTCPIYQNIDGNGYVEIETIKKNLINQLTSPVNWTKSILNMIKCGSTHFTECGPGKVLQGLVRKTNQTVNVSGIS